MQKTPGRHAAWLFTEQRMKAVKKYIVNLMGLEDFLRDYLDKSPDDSSTDVMHWSNIFIYNYGDFIKQIVYRKTYGGKRWEKRLATEAFGEAMFALMIVAIKSGIDIAEAADIVADKYNNQEWKKKN